MTDAMLINIYKGMGLLDVARAAGRRTIDVMSAWIEWRKARSW